MGHAEEWGRDRLGELFELVDESLPRDKPSPDELLACCWDDAGAVLGRPDGSAAVSVVTRTGGQGTRGFVRLLAVHPGARRQGFGAELLAEAETWLLDHGATTLSFGAARPFFLWPGLEVHDMLPARCLAEQAGYATTGAHITMSLPVTFRAPLADGLSVRRVLDDEDAAAAVELAGFEWPSSLELVERTIEQGTCLAVLEDGPDARRAVALAGHSANRGGWLDLLGVSSSCRRRGIGSALLGETCTDLMVASYRDVEVVAAEPIGFFAHAGAGVSHVYAAMTKPVG